MFRFYTKSLFFLLALTLTTSSAFAQFTPVADSVALGANYVDQVYYSLVSGDKTTAPKNEWDIAFQASGLANGGIWVNKATSPATLVYQIPNADSSDWGTTIDTTGYATWQELQNGKTSWAEGAFNANSTGGLDYGWGTYTGGAPHNVNGDSLYLLQLTDGSFKVLFIEQLNGVGSFYKFRFADIDGSNEVVDSVSKNSDRNLVYYNLRTAAELDREPANNEWDLWFTNGLTADVIAGPPGTPLSVASGTVYTNRGIQSVQVSGVPNDSADYTTAVFDSVIFNIGDSYRVRNGVWEVPDSNVYFVKAKDNEIYKLVFTAYEGQGTGKIVFEKTQMTSSAVGIDEVSNATRVLLYPNPTIDRLNIVLDAAKAGLHNVTVTDLTGKVVYNTSVNVDGLQNINIPVSNFANGYYLVSVETNGTRSVQKFVKQ